MAERRPPTTVMDDEFCFVSFEVFFPALGLVFVGNVSHVYSPLLSRNLKFEDGFNLWLTEALRT